MHSMYPKRRVVLTSIRFFRNKNGYGFINSRNNRKFDIHGEGVSSRFMKPYFDHLLLAEQVIENGLTHRNLEHYGLVGLFPSVLDCL